MDSQELKNIIESALLASGGPLTVDQLCSLFADEQAPEKKEVRAALSVLAEDYDGRGIELREVASGFRIQVRESMSQWLTKLWEERPPRYSRALMETLAIVAYRQPVTRGDVEEIRGVSVTTNIVRTLLERDWIKVVGHRDVPGKPAMFGTTREFLDYFSLKKLDDLPPLAELAQMEPVALQLQLGTADQLPGGESGQEQEEASSDGSSEFFSENSEEISAEAVAEADDWDDASESEIDVAPGAVAPLVGLNSPGEEQPEAATVASLDDARAAAQAVSEDDADESAAADGKQHSADVVPLKSS
jgi:segregation and condensation protein B